MSEATTESPLTLATLRAGQRLRGLVPGRAVTLIAMDPVDAGLVEVFCRDDSGRVGARAITDADVARFEIAGDFDSASAFDADPDEFRLAAEALRIKYAALYDPMVAVNTSDVDPLPHQIRAVYEELLPRIPLRFLLADDPGEGKTIMAGLYLKELILAFGLRARDHRRTRRAGRAVARGTGHQVRSALRGVRPTDGRRRPRAKRLRRTPVPNRTDGSTFAERRSGGAAR